MESAWHARSKRESRALEIQHAAPAAIERDECSLKRQIRHPIGKTPGRRVGRPRKEISRLRENVRDAESFSKIMVQRVEPDSPSATEATESPRDGSVQPASLQLYLREIGKVKLLTPQEEIELAKR